MALLVNGAALSAAVLGIQWGAAPPRVNALPLVWGYVHLAVGASYFLLWPTLALRFSPLAYGRPLSSALTSLYWDFSALILAAIPSVGCAAWLGEVPPDILWSTLALQGGLGLFVLGILAWREVGPRTQGSLALLLTTLFLLLPLVGYLQREFLPGTPAAWQLAAPAFAIAHAAWNGAAILTYWLAGIYAALGLLLLAIPYPTLVSPSAPRS